MKKTDADEQTDGQASHTNSTPHEASKFLLDVFQRSAEKLEPGDRESVLTQHNKLVRSFTLLSEKIGEILNSEEGRRLMQQELQARERSKK